jgi:hypothetical protein
MSPNYASRDDGGPAMGRQMCRSASPAKPPAVVTALLQIVHCGSADFPSDCQLG